MIDYQLPKFEFKKLKSSPSKPKKKGGIKFPQFWKNQTFLILIISIFVSSIFGFLAGAISGSIFHLEIREYLSQFPSEKTVEVDKETIIEKEYIPQTTQEEAIIRVVNQSSPAIVSIVITQYVEEYYFLPFEEVPFQRKVEKREVGGGSGFIVSEEGMILTNKHVFMSDDAEYTVLTIDGRSFAAQVLARDPVQDLAILKIEDSKPFPTVKLGNSDKLQVGQTVIAIGNVLGEFRNSVSLGVVSGLGRTITASGGGLVATIEDVIQTDAAINKGNSGGPLLNLKGEVIGVNTATVLAAENVSFAIPINKAKRGIEQVKTLGKIVYPFLGIRYVIITDQIQKENNLAVSYGAWIVSGIESGEPAIFPGSAAQTAGLQEGDIVLEFNGKKITTDNSLAKIIMNYNPGETVVLKIYREGKEKIISVTLGERSE